MVGALGVEGAQAVGGGFRQPRVDFLRRPEAEVLPRLDQHRDMVAGTRPGAAHFALPHIEEKRLEHIHVRFRRTVADRLDRFRDDDADRPAFAHRAEGVGVEGGHALRQDDRVGQAVQKSVGPDRFHPVRDDDVGDAGGVADEGLAVSRIEAAARCREVLVPLLDDEGLGGLDLLEDAGQHRRVRDIFADDEGLYPAFRDLRQAGEILGDFAPAGEGERPGVRLPFPFKAAAEAAGFGGGR